MRFLIPLKRSLTTLPPLVSVVRGLAALGHRVTLLNYHVEPSIVEKIACDSVRLVTVDTDPYPSGLVRRTRATARSYVALYRELAHRSRHDYVWMGNWDFHFYESMVRLAGTRVPVIYQIHELEERSLRFAGRADHVVVPERNRAWITFVEAGLDRVPHVLPNSPFAHPRTVREPRDPTLERLRGEGKRIVIYQGYVHLGKRCLEELYDAMALLPEDVVLALMPAQVDQSTALARLDERASRLGIGHRVFVLESRPAPLHLDVVGRAHVGIGLYRPTSLNNVYSAPNRLFECCGFGMPVVLPHYPGFTSLAERYAGIRTCDPESPASIAGALEELTDPSLYRTAAEGANEFFDAEGVYLDHLERVIAEVGRGGGRS